jgi:hypothetical protein
MFHVDTEVPIVTKAALRVRILADIEALYAKLGVLDEICEEIGIGAPEKHVPSVTPEPNVQQEQLADLVLELHGAGKTPPEISDELFLRGHVRTAEEIQRFLATMGSEPHTPSVVPPPDRIERRQHPRAEHCDMRSQRPIESAKDKIIRLHKRNVSPRDILKNISACGHSGWTTEAVRDYLREKGFEIPDERDKGTQKLLEVLRDTGDIGKACRSVRYFKINEVDALEILRQNGFKVPENVSPYAQSPVGTGGPIAPVLPTTPVPAPPPIEKPKSLAELPSYAAPDAPVRTESPKITTDIAFENRIVKEKDDELHRKVRALIDRAPCPKSDRLHNSQIVSVLRDLVREVPLEAIPDEYSNLATVQQIQRLYGAHVPLLQQLSKPYERNEYFRQLLERIGPQHNREGSYK